MFEFNRQTKGEAQDLQRYFYELARLREKVSEGNERTSSIHGQGEQSSSPRNLAWERLVHSHH